MKKLCVVFVLFCLCLPCLAQDEEGNSPLSLIFVEIKNGKEYLYVRMPAAQWRTAKLRARVQGTVEIGLNVRQRLALKNLLGEQYDWNRVGVQVKAEQLRALKGLKNHYLAFDKDLLCKSQGKVQITGEVEESDIELGKHEYQRQPVPPWEVKPEEYLLLTNANIVDVDKGMLRKERGVLIRNQRIEKLLSLSELATASQQYPLKKVLNLNNQYLIPGLSDIHCHLTLISEFKMGMREILKYFKSQRLRNAEEALKNGCTFVRDCVGAAPQLEYLIEEIEANRLLGPKIMASKGAITPKGGMWDVGKVKNELARVIFGGKMLWFPENNQDILAAMEELHKSGGKFFKFYFEEKPLYGGEPTTLYKMFTLEQARLIKEQADKYGKQLAAHAMFMNGIRLLIEAGFNTIEHCSCEEPYSLEIAQKMKEKNIAVIPTLSLGSYLSMNCGQLGSYKDPEVIFFQELRNSTYRQDVERYVIPELQARYLQFFEWLAQPIENREMPMIGPVHILRVHSFARLAPQSIANLRKAGARVGVGTDGGTGITFSGNVAREMALLHRYGYTPAEVLRMATLGNMEILKMDKELGSLDVGKYADMVVLPQNPLENVAAVATVTMVFKNGRLYCKN